MPLGFELCILFPYSLVRLPQRVRGLPACLCSSKLTPVTLVLWLQVQRLLPPHLAQRWGGQLVIVTAGPSGTGFAR